MLLSDITRDAGDADAGAPGQRRHLSQAAYTSPDKHCCRYAFVLFVIVYLLKS